MDEYEKYDNGDLLRVRYLKVADISEGSYGLVSLAKDIKSDDKLVAVKFIYPLDYKKETKKESDSRPSSFPAKLRPSSSRSTLQSKASILKALYEEAAKEISIHKILGTHPNIAALYDNFDSCLVLEYCSRGDLYEAIQNGKGPTTSQDIKDVFYQILNALEYCHSHNVFHRDLKPENILIAEDWSIKLCDWGLATTTRKITNKNEFDIGSERYMAPELFDPEIEFYDASKIDLWSVGIILLTLVFHKNPFQVANYSDKRFIQFGSNREALFDIFSTMSGEMFSVLRYCLNIDPNNRDLISLRNELDNLKYFTIDEEYWASDYDDEEADIDDDDFDFYNDDDYFYKKSEHSVSVSPAKEPSIVTASKSAFEVKQIATDLKQPGSSPSTTESETTNSKSNFSKSPNYSDETTIPHNHRADALLSSNTELKPIPIGGSNLRFIRNNRKPFNVASYNQSSYHNNFSKYNNNRFNREDFFTPKSVFNHYMVKYGEQKLNNNKNHNHYHHHSNNPDWKKKGKGRRSWKKTNKSNNNHNNSNKHKTRNKSSTAQNNHRHYNNHDNSNHHHSNHPHNRRKSSSFSNSKSRKAVSTISSNSLNTSLYPLNSQTNNLHQFNPATSSTASVSGKYIPPFLRSPNYTRSPVIGPLTEEIDNLTLNNDDDEVFHLEDDFELGDKNNDLSHHSYSSINKPSVMPSSSGSNGDILFKKPNFKAPTYAIPSIDYSSTNSHGSSRNYNTISNAVSNGNRTITVISGRRQSSTIPNGGRPNSMGDNPINELTNSVSSPVGSATGKYIPPFRRGSHSSNIPSSMATGKARPTSVDRKKVIDHHHSPMNKVNNPLGQLSNVTSTSVPSDKTDWFSFKKD